MTFDFTQYVRHACKNADIKLIYYKIIVLTNRSTNHNSLINKHNYSYKTNNWQYCVNSADKMRLKLAYTKLKPLFTNLTRKKADMEKIISLLNAVVQPNLSKTYIIWYDDGV